MIEVYPLGAGQDVGRSCILITIEDKCIMLDCGVHMGFQDMRKYPDFSKLKQPIDLVLISHFHLDHCGALPYFTELYDKKGYQGPIVMTTPTKAIFPYMLEDFRKLILDNQGFPGEPTFSLEELKRCMNKIQTIQLHESREIAGIKIKSYYAGHVLGACMFYIEYKGQSVVYTGDFNSSADRHLGAAWIEKCYPDVLISESTYATTYRDSKRAREMDFLHQIQTTIDQGGKVLIPVFALGRAQELCILLETYWSRMKNQVPIYFAAGMIEKAHFYYKLFVHWMNEKIKSSFVTHNMFEFKHIRPFDRNLLKSPQPMVLFATPGMLHGGLSMQVFKDWCEDSKNTLIIPGYCVAGTLGNKLLTGSRNLTMDGKNYDVQMKILSMSFSAHADCKGIMQLIQHTEPKHVVFVHGEKHKMFELGKVVKQNTGIPVSCPANFESVTFKTCPKETMKIGISPGVSLMQDKYKGYLVKDVNDTIQFVNKDNLQDFLCRFDEFNFALSILKSEHLDLDYHDIQQGICMKISQSLLDGNKDLKSFFEKQIQNILQESPQLLQIQQNLEINILDDILLVNLVSSEDFSQKILQSLHQELLKINQNH